ncbi:MAG: hypothetical protein JSV59_11890 [Flavobacteriaceae bacterium]|nr:MAG: hypothetical protein JSV59_11890 [Flavobacteriaceae bacterium]
MKRGFIYSLFIIFIIIVSCTQKSKKAISKVYYIDSPATENSSLPNLFSSNENTLLSWVEMKDDTLAILYYAELKNGKWQAPREILKGDDWFVNWADFPMITENKGQLLSHVLKKSSPDTYSYDIKLNILPRDSNNWVTNLPLHTDETPTEHGFVTALPYKEDSFFISWLDGRNTLEKEDGSRGAMTLRAAEVSVNGKVSNEVVLDSSTCDCCQTTAVMTSNGPVVIYRDRTENEIRDMSIVRNVAGKWTAPKTIYPDNWLIKGCPVNGPKAASSGNNLAIAWFTAANDQPKVNLAFSNDGGISFDDPIRIDDATSIGRVDVLLLDKKIAIVSWMQMEDEGAVLMAVKVDSLGNRGEAVLISRLEGSRGTGFPQMELVGDKVYFAWTLVSEEGSHVKTAYVSADQF